MKGTTYIPIDIPQVYCLRILLLVGDCAVASPTSLSNSHLKRCLLLEDKVAQEARVDKEKVDTRYQSLNISTTMLCFYHVSSVHLPHLESNVSICVCMGMGIFKKVFIVMFSIVRRMKRPFSYSNQGAPL